MYYTSVVTDSILLSPFSVDSNMLSVVPFMFAPAVITPTCSVTTTPLWLRSITITMIQDDGSLFFFLVL